MRKDILFDIVWTYISRIYFALIHHSVSLDHFDMYIYLYITFVDNNYQQLSARPDNL